MFERFDEIYRIEVILVLPSEQVNIISTDFNYAT